jgi:hypothetical protein
MDETVCQEKRELLALYQHAARKYSEAVIELKQKIGTIPKPEYDAFHRVTMEAEHNARAARRRLEDPIAGHRC